MMIKTLTKWCSGDDCDEAVDEDYLSRFIEEGDGRRALVGKNLRQKPPRGRRCASCACRDGGAWGPRIIGVSG